jgi:hypothetical protein
MVKFLKELPEPGHFSNSIGDGAILCLGAWLRNSGLSLGGPRDKTTTEKDGVARGGTASVGAAGPIGVGVDNKLT